VVSFSSSRTLSLYTSARGGVGRSAAAVVGPVRERAGAVVAARAAVVVRGRARWWLHGRVRPTEAVRGGVRQTEM